jgi:hypothetical protein
MKSMRTVILIGFFVLADAIVYTPEIPNPDLYTDHPTVTIFFSILLITVILFDLIEFFGIEEQNG